jgi:rhodanese-related sulfurtransferase
MSAFAALAGLATRWSESAMRSEEVGNGILEHWSPDEVRDAYERNDIVLIDVRTPQEYMVEKIDGALLAPIVNFNPDKMPAQDGKRIVFYCGGGGRSRKAAELTLQNGADKIAHMEGGFGAWKNAGLPFVGTEAMTGSPRKMP